MRNIHIFGGESKAFTPVQLEVEFTSGCQSCGSFTGKFKTFLTFSDVYEFNKFIDSNSKSSGIFIDIYQDGKKVSYESK